MCDMASRSRGTQSEKTRADIRLPPGRSKTLEGRYHQGAGTCPGGFRFCSDGSSASPQRQTLAKPIENLAGIHHETFIGVARLIELPGKGADDAFRRHGRRFRAGIHPQKGARAVSDLKLALPVAAMSEESCLLVA